MAFIDPIKRLTATIQLEYRPEDTMFTKLKFVQADGTTPFDMSSYDLELSVYASTVLTDFSSNLVPKVSDGTEQFKKVVAKRQARNNGGNLIVPNENGIYLEDAENSIFTIQYGKEEGAVFLIGDYFMTLSARLQHGQWKSLVSYKVRFHNDIVDNGLIITNPNFFVLPVLRTEVSTFILPIQNIL